MLKCRKNMKYDLATSKTIYHYNTMNAKNNIVSWIELIMLKWIIIHINKLELQWFLCSWDSSLKTVHLQYYLSVNCGGRVYCLLVWTVHSSHQSADHLQTYLHIHIQLTNEGCAGKIEFNKSNTITILVNSIIQIQPSYGYCNLIFW